MTDIVPTPAEWRAAMGQFPTGVTIVTTWHGDVAVGSTINAFCSVSLEPPLLLICLSDVNPLREAIKDSGVFGVNILGEGDPGLAMTFAKGPPTGAPVAADDFHAGENGSPHLKSALTFIDCKVQDWHVAGDHFIVIGRGLRTHHAHARPPLLYHRGGFLKVLSAADAALDEA